MQEQVDEQDRADRDAARDQPSAGSEPGGELGDGHRSDLRLKMLWAASVALVRIWAASSIASFASSTVTTALSGSLTVPVASACEALEALCWVFSSEEIASVSCAAEAR